MYKLKRSLEPEVRALSKALPNFILKPDLDPTADDETPLWRLARALRLVEEFPTLPWPMMPDSVTGDYVFTMDSLRHTALRDVGFTERDLSKLRAALGAAAGLELDPFWVNLERDHDEVIAQWREVFTDCLNRASHTFANPDDYWEEPEPGFFELGVLWERTCRLHRVVKSVDLVLTTFARYPGLQSPL